MARGVMLAVVMCLWLAPATQAQSRGSLVWTVTGAGAGFGIGLWAGLTAFDDAVNSDRKVWTSAIVGAGAGALAGYFISRPRDSRAATPAQTRRDFDPHLVATITQSIRLGGGRQSRN